MSLIAEPVTHDNIYFYAGGGDDGFYVEVPMNSGRNARHGCAEPSRLYALLTHTSNPPVPTPAGVSVFNLVPKEEPAHFYCAQLLHYGLKPLKTKPAAKKALLKAFGTGQTLTVPEHIIQIREQLKAEYTIANEAATQQREEQERQRKKIEDEQAKARKKVAEEREKEMRKTEQERREESRRLFDQIMAEGVATKLDSSATCGCFQIHAPSLSEEWPDMCRPGLTLRMSPSSTSGRHLWISFDFGVLTGIARGSFPPTNIGGSCSFKWRGEETGEGQLLYGSENKGTITFLGSGKIIGMIEGEFFGKAQFVGIRDEEKSRNRVWSKNVQGWKSEYRHINPSASAVASAGRWGGWVEDTSQRDKPEDSDTTADGIGLESESEEDGKLGDSDLDDVHDYLHQEEDAADETEQPIVPQKRGHRTKSTARRSRPFIRSSDTRQTGYRTKQTAIKSSGMLAISEKATQGAKANGKPNGAAKLEYRDTSGQYDVDCPGLRDNWGEHFMGTYTLKMSPSKGMSRIWATFDFGVVSGIMRCTALPVAVGESCTFYWRGREEGEGEMTFSDCNNGTITFCGNGRIEGTIAGDLFKETPFSGTVNSGASRNTIWARYIPEWKEEYRGINEVAYNAAARSRWGKWSAGRGHHEAPEASDTSDGEANADSDCEMIYDPDVEL
ncbi:hypothetical protein BDW22DRAFT_373419 [Trametopsis cervina]|nr:hypothetical protein BDW22DRAFT_373419 [Trametopsis cervina]